MQCLENDLQKEWLLAHTDGGSNLCLVTSSTLLYNMKSYDGDANGTGGEKSKFTVLGIFQIIYRSELKSITIIAEKCYVMTTNKH